MIKFNLQKVLDIKLRQEMNKLTKAEKKKEQTDRSKIPMAEAPFKVKKGKTDKGT
ncbi:MAG: hypothetical protein IPL53_17660 [Ignavibacteria bacterium]|nr:hypothetical protein [Ignavibacteria bacterium]